MKTLQLLLVITLVSLFFQDRLLAQHKLSNPESIDIYESIFICGSERITFYSFTYLTDSISISRFSDPIRTGPRYVDASYTSKKSIFRKKKYGTGIEYYLDLHKILNQRDSEYVKFRKVEKTSISQAEYQKLFSWLNLGIHQRIRQDKIWHASTTFYLYLIKVGNTTNEYSLMSKSFSLFLEGLFESPQP